MGPMVRLGEIGKYLDILKGAGITSLDVSILNHVFTDTNTVRRDRQ